MNSQVKAQHLDRWIDDESTPGAFCYYNRKDEEDISVVGGLVFVCPCGCGTQGSLNFTEGKSPLWKWNGKVDSPTLHPSILQGSCGWHGWLEDGHWIKLRG